ncbi:MAG: hypothetical protein Q9163_004189 [Psora crenata]
MAQSNSLENPFEVPSIESISALSLEMPPSCVQFSPKDPAYFLVGSYQLKPIEGDQIESAAQKRNGSLVLFRFRDLHPCFCADVSTQYAVLDLKFSPCNGNNFVVATSTGAIELYSLDLVNGTTFRKLQAFQICKPSILVLSVAWGPSNDTKSSIAMSLSDGKVGVLSYEPCRHNVALVQAHSLEAWIAQWSKPAETDSIANLYSGGDDSAICAHRAQMGSEQLDFGNREPEGEEYRPLGQNKRIHTAGVTAIQPVPIQQGPMQVLITGSYDEYVRVVAVGLSGNSWTTLAEERLHGGVWKLQVLAESRAHEDGTVAFDVLASCMHAGTRVLRIGRSSKQEWSIKVLAKFVEHDSMNYATVARKSLPNEGAHGSMIVVSTSFYDRKLCVWNIHYPLPTD